MEAKSFFLIAIATLTIQLTGCTTESRIAIINNDQDLRSAGTKLAAAADSISKSLQELAEIDRATHPQTRLPSPVEPGMIGMGQLGSIDWSGPVAPLVKKIAEATNYKFKILGTPPAVPILISIAAKDTPLADILRDVAFQCGSKANIVTYPASKTIELRYVKS
ncbi:MAG: type IVB secretion system lipoprotein DotD [bacterium]